MNLPGLFSTNTTGGSFQDDRLNVMFRIWLFEFVSYFGFRVSNLVSFISHIILDLLYHASYIGKRQIWSKDSNTRRS